MLDKAEDEADSIASHVEDNLKITVSGVHIRYIDDVSDPLRQFTLGVNLEMLCVAFRLGSHLFWRFRATSSRRVHTERAIFSSTCLT